jgi:pimeloyl-ACP methyl ester carboxylesterase
MDWKNVVKSRKPQDLWFESHDCMIHAHQWNNEKENTVIFVHGAMANNVWWQPIAACIKAANVLSIDLSGHGLSAWDETYSVQKHAKEIINLIEKFSTGKVYIVGHSYGGTVSAYVASLIAVTKVIMVDTPLYFSRLRMPTFHKLPIYESIEKAVSRFIPIPKQPIADQVLLDWLARKSIRKVEGGYTWQFDPKSLDRSYSDEVIKDIKLAISGKGVWLYGQHSPFATQKALELAFDMQLNTEMIENAHHAVMLDAPMVLLEKLERVIH